VRKHNKTDRNRPKPCTSTIKKNPDAPFSISIYNQPLILEKRKKAAISTTLLPEADSAEQKIGQTDANL